ncbi:hypothetical protein PUW25_25505 (plasmid) [Paenibacillus urinalis]|uniref:Uncharacterized protein n=1 Tax=Paenibacillus urinalis TaxID=521520 RepID=A0ABY7XHC1_9BACL|nr:hypothetical protein [Paenibacillus urinalis]WDI05168.1 hypothetical protein PUW25_25505 [Paenibacillus urinalis]
MNRYDEDYSRMEIRLRNMEAFSAVKKMIEHGDVDEAPLNTIVSMYPLFEMDIDMPLHELEYRIRLLHNADYVYIRNGAYGSEMVSITELGLRRYTS